MTASATTTSSSRQRTPFVATKAALLLSILALALLPSPSMASATTTRMLGTGARRSSSQATAFIGSWAASPLLHRSSSTSATSSTSSTRLGSSRLTQHQQGQPRAGPRAFFSQGRRSSSMRRVAGSGFREDLTRLWGTISNTTLVSQVGGGLGVLIHSYGPLTELMESIGVLYHHHHRSRTTALRK